MSINRKQARSLSAIFFTFFIDYLGATIIFPIFAPLFLEQKQGLFHSSMSHTARITLLGLFLAVFPLMQFIFAPLVGDYADRHGRKRALVITTIVTMIGYTATGLCMQFGFVWLLFVARMLMGASSGNLSVCLTAISDVSSSKKKVVRYYTLGSVIAGFTFVVGPIIGGKLSDPTVNSLFFPAFPLYVGAALTLINVVFLIFFFYETIKKKTSQSFDLAKSMINLKIAFKTPSLKKLYAIFFFYLLSWNVMFQFLPAFLVERFSLSNSMIGNVLAILGGCWIIGSLFFKFIYHRIPSKSILIISSVVFAALILLSIDNSGVTRFSILIGIAVFFSSFPWPLCTGEISDAAPAVMQGQIMGLSQSVQSLAMLIAPLIAAPLMSAHYGLAFGVAALFSLVYPFLLFGLKLDK
jgi:MFS transporter, DHA1 family, tetracycline resistance protein